ncbi:MAG: hypothetical protein GX321_00185 [Clostridiales bacterium]|nr:hypothetical protein [Clostridiales bacterium]
MKMADQGGRDTKAMKIKKGELFWILMKLFIREDRLEILKIRRLIMRNPDKDEKPILQHVIQVEDRLHYNKW